MKLKRKESMLGAYILLSLVFIVGLVVGIVSVSVIDQFEFDKLVASICKMRYGNGTYVDFHTELDMACFSKKCPLALDVYVNGTFIGKITDKYTCEVEK